MGIGDEIYVRGYVDEIRKDTVIVRNDGGYFGTVENEVYPVLGDADGFTKGYDNGVCDTIKAVLEIIDKQENKYQERDWFDSGYIYACRHFRAAVQALAEGREE